MKKINCQPYINKLIILSFSQWYRRQTYKLHDNRGANLTLWIQTEIFTMCAQLNPDKKSAQSRLAAKKSLKYGKIIILKTLHAFYLQLLKDKTLKKCFEIN